MVVGWLLCLIGHLQRCELQSDLRRSPSSELFNISEHEHFGNTVSTFRILNPLIRKYGFNISESKSVISEIRLTSSKIQNASVLEIGLEFRNLDSARAVIHIA